MLIFYLLNNHYAFELYVKWEDNVYNANKLDPSFFMSFFFDRRGQVSYPREMSIEFEKKITNLVIWHLSCCVFFDLGVFLSDLIED